SLPGGQGTESLPAATTRVGMAAGPGGGFAGSGHTRGLRPAPSTLPAGGPVKERPPGRRGHAPLVLTVRDDTVARGAEDVLPGPARTEGPRAPQDRRRPQRHSAATPRAGRYRRERRPTDVAGAARRGVVEGHQHLAGDLGPPGPRLPQLQELGLRQ